MRIQHNIMAMNAYRNYSNNTSALSKNLEKLSSGYKINRAGDDAAGLAISEKMRAQITGLEAAQKNVKDGISLVQTAEGAMQEVQDMLNRMVYLANQSANGTYDDDVDRANLQKEVDQLRDEIDRIADSANFNGIKLLDGSLDANGTMAAKETQILSASHIQFHKAGVTEQAPSFQIDLNQVLNGAVMGTKANSVTFKVNVGGQSYTATAGLTASLAKGAMITADNINSVTVTANTKASVTSGGTKLIFDMKCSGGVMTFTFNSASSANASGVQDFNSSLDVTFTKGSNIGDLSAKYEEACKTQNVVDGKKAGVTQYAHGQFSVNKALVDALAGGGTLTLGNQKITFDKTTSTTTAGNTVGVKDLLDASGNVKTDADTLAEIANRITQAAAGNTTFTVGVGADNTTIDLHEKKDYYKNTDETLLDTQAKMNKVVNLTSGGGSGKALTLQIGDNSESYNQLKVSIGDIHCSALKIDAIDIGTQAGAAAAVDTIKTAINNVSSIRGTLGATQNRLDHTANNLSVMRENIQDAESSIRDTDIAEEMMSYTKNNILIQSAQAMLAQANQVPQGVLQLLQ